MRAHTRAYVVPVRNSQSVGQNDPRLCEPGRQDKQSHPCSVGSSGAVPPDLTRLTTHSHPTPLCLMVNHLEVNLAD